jgi:TetR/AcrR family transcriptional regulator
LLLVSSASDLKSIALGEFATVGYAGTSLSRIAELAGLSKSSVLYHYASKEALLEAAIGPAIDKMAAILDTTSSQPLTAARRKSFIAGFVDFLLEHRLEVNLFINQGSSLVDVPVVDRANALVRRLAEYFSSAVADTEEQMRFGIALGGAAYMLCTMRSLELAAPPTQEIQSALVTIMTELLVPVETSPATRE